MQKTKISFRNILIIASLIFGMLFGAGNLIFPIHLGQLSGANWITASAGFLFSGVLLPLIALFALSVTHSNSLFDLAKPIGSFYASAFLVLVHATIGPLFALPRTATVPYTVGFTPFLPKNFENLGLIIYTTIFFIIVFALTATESKITDLIGKILNPIFLVLLFLIFFLAFLHPMGNAHNAGITAEYVNNSFISGFLQGYNTMDCLACLVFGVTIISAVREFGLKNDSEVSLVTAKGGFIGILGIGIIYLCLIWLGATSLSQFSLAQNGGTTLAQIFNYYLGAAGNALLAALTSLTCLTTGMGLAAAFALDFHDRFPKFSYKFFLAINCILSFIVANMGLDTIISWSKPVLMLIYPLAITLVILGSLSPLFKNDRIVYKITTIFTIVPAIFDMINALPPVLKNTSSVKIINKLASQFIPFFNLGFGWLSFAIIGFAIGLLIHLLKKAK